MNNRRIVVACPGPSLRSAMMTPDRWPILESGRAALVVVNRAAELVAPAGEIIPDRPLALPLQHGEEWHWCFGDHVAHELFRLRGGVGRPGLFVPAGVMQAWEAKYPATWESFGKHYAGPGARVETWDEKNLPEREKPTYSTWRSKSGIAGIVLGVRLALRQGLTRVDVVGADMRGENDHAGERTDGRKRQRWQGERQRYNQARFWANKVGVELVRWTDADGGMVPSRNAVRLIPEP